MDQDFCFLPWHVRVTPRVPVTPVFGAFLAAPEAPSAERRRRAPEEPPDGMLPLTFWSHRHAVASAWYPCLAHKHILGSPFFRAEPHLAFVSIFPREHPGWLRVNVAAISADTVQLKAFAGLLASLGEQLPFCDAGFGRLGLYLGHHWIPVPADLAARLREDCEETRVRVGAFTDDVNDRLLHGDEAEVASRLLNSIPGIRGERRDACRRRPA